MGAAAFVRQQLEPESIDDRRCQWRVDEMESLQLPRGELYEVWPPSSWCRTFRARLLRALHWHRRWRS